MGVEDLECYLGLHEITSESRWGVADSIGMKEHTPQTKRIDERTFSVVRKGYDPREVKTYLEDLEHAFQDIEGHARRTSQKVVELERKLSASRATEKASLDNAMLAVFDVKDRVMDQAERRAKAIQEEADKTASSMLAEAAAARGREPELETRIADLENELVRTRADGERLRMQLNDAHATLDHIESTATVDITSLQAQLKHEQLQNAELRSAAREVDWVRRDFEHKLALAQEQAMHAKADAEAVRADLEALRATITERRDESTSTVVYERPGEVADYEFAVAAMTEEGLSERLSEAI
jgi:cell division septum initiation protein DivIVA